MTERTRLTDAEVAELPTALRDEIEQLRSDVAEARLWARAFRELDVYRWWKGGVWGLPDEQPAWLQERLPLTDVEQSARVPGWERGMTRPPPGAGGADVPIGVPEATHWETTEDDLL